MKTLLVTLDNLGDTILAIPVYDALRAIPGLEVSLWTKEYTAGLSPLLQGRPEIFHCDPFWDRAPGQPKGSLSKYLSTLKTIRSGEFASALVLSSNWRKNLSCAAAGIGERWAGSGAFATRRLQPAAPGEHVLDSYRRTITEFSGKDPGELTCRLAPPPAGKPSGRPYAAIHPFSGGPARNLPLPAWLEIISALRADGLQILVIATPAEKNLLPPDAAAGVNFSCDTEPGLPGLAALLSGAALFIGNDSGPLHMAAALGARSVGIIQSKKVPLIGPRGRRPVGLAVFMESPAEISPASVLALAKKALAA